MALPSSKIICNVTFIVNDSPIAYINNTLTYTTGKGEYKVRTQVGGGSIILTSACIDVETAVSTIKVDVLPTQFNIDFFKDVKNRHNGNVIHLTDGQDFNVTFQNTFLANDYEVQLSGDGKISLEFKGDPAV